MGSRIGSRLEQPTWKVHIGLNLKYTGSDGGGSRFVGSGGRTYLIH